MPFRRPPHGRDSEEGGSGTTLFSCDVFDTALIRAIGTPSALFLFLGKRLSAAGMIQCSAEVFAHARIEANRRARSNIGRGVGLGDIYRDLQFAFGLTDLERDEMRAEELTLEAEVLRPVPGASERLARARAAGQTVVFLSDMYLDSTFIREQLQRHGLWEEGDRCYVSCEAGCGKEDGRGFRLMAEIEGVALRSVIHRGNDPRADVAAARQVGAAVEPFLEGNLNRHEAALTFYSYATGGLASLMAGASRLARLSVPASSTDEVALRDVAASVLGPTVASYLLWVLSTSRTMGMRRLHFQPTNGDFLARVADSLRVTLGQDCEIMRAGGQEQDPGRRASGNPDEAFVLLGSDGLRATLAAANEHHKGVPATFTFARFAGGQESSNVDADSLHAYFADHPRRVGHLGRPEQGQLELLLGTGGGQVATPPIVAETVVAFSEALWLRPELLDLTVDMRPAVAEVVHMFFASPSPAEARAWGLQRPSRLGEGLRAVARRLKRGVIRAW